MEWKDVATTIGKTAPMLGSLLAGKAGEAVGSIVSSVLGCENTPSAISQAIAVNPDAAVKLSRVESEQKTKLQELAVTSAQNLLVADTQRILAVNATMQAEASSDHWPTYTWRPFCGFVVATMAFGCYFVLPLCKATVPSIPLEVWGMFGAILGVASWFRGKMQADPNIPTDNRG